MVTVTPAMSVTPHGDPVIEWRALATDDTAVAWEINRKQGRHAAVQANGSFSSGTLTIEGSNDNVNFYPLDDVNGATVNTNSPALFELSTSARYIRPVKSGGSGSASVDVLIIFRGA